MHMCLVCTKRNNKVKPWGRGRRSASRQKHHPVTGRAKGRAEPIAGYLGSALLLTQACICQSLSSLCLIRSSQDSCQSTTTSIV